MITVCELCISAIAGEVTYHVLETDYDNYAVMFACRSGANGFLHAKSVYVLGRTRELPSNILNEVYRVLDENNLSRSYLIVLNQKNCNDSDPSAVDSNKEDLIEKQKS